MPELSRKPERLLGLSKWQFKLSDLKSAVAPMENPVVGGKANATTPEAHGQIVAPTLSPTLWAVRMKWWTRSARA